MNWIAAIVSVVIAQAAGGIGALFTTPKIASWYATIAKPTWNPPSWVFGPVWTLLFVLMGVAASLVWARRGQSSVAQSALIAYGVQLVLNICWSYLFFGLESPGAAVVGIAALIIAILITIVLFWRVTPAAGWLMLPYLAWVSFASFLNFTVWRLNP
jgi:tryptophan-rich sensory protein